MGTLGKELMTGLGTEVMWLRKKQSKLKNEKHNVLDCGESLKPLGDQSVRERALAMT